MQLSIIIPTKNARTTLLPCLRKIQGINLVHEIIVVNDHSTDDLRSLVSSLVGTIIDLKGVTGPGAARNAGAGIAQGEVLLFIDSDVFTSAEDIEKSYGEFINCHYSCAVARYRHNAELAMFGRYYNQYMMYKYIDKDTTQIFFSSYAMIKKACFVPFSERLKTLEDAAIGHELVQAGHEIHLFKSMEVTHQKQVDGVGLTKQFFVRSRDAVVLSWSLFRKGGALHDDSVKGHMRLSLVLLPLMLILGFFSGLAYFLLVPLLLVNISYFLFITRFEGVGGFLASVLIYFYTIICGNIGMTCGLLKVLAHELTAPFAIRKTPLV